MNIDEDDNDGEDNDDEDDGNKGNDDDVDMGGGSYPSYGDDAGSGYSYHFMFCGSAYRGSKDSRLS